MFSPRPGVVVFVVVFVVAVAFKGQEQKSKETVKADD